MLVADAGRLDTQPWLFHIDLGEWKSMLLSQCITPIPATMATLFMSLWRDDRGGWGKRLTSSYRTSHPIHFIIKNPLLLRSSFGEHL